MLFSFRNNKFVIDRKIKQISYRLHLFNKQDLLSVIIVLQKKNIKIYQSNIEKEKKKSLISFSCRIKYIPLYNIYWHLFLISYVMD